MPTTYWQTVHRRAIHRARESLWIETGERAVIAAILAVFAIVMIWVIGGPTGAWEQFLVRLGGTLAIILLFPFVYFINVIREPARLYGEASSRISELEAKNTQLNERKPDFHGIIDWIASGGQIRSSDGIHYGVLLFVTIFNRGTLSSVAVSWFASVRLNGEWHKLPITHAQGITMNPAGSRMQIDLDENNTIYHKSLEPIPPGGVAQGHALCLFPPNIAESRDNISIIKVHFRDAFDNDYELHHEFGRLLEHIPYAPGMRVSTEESR